MCEAVSLRQHRARYDSPLALAQCGLDDGRGHADESPEAADEPLGPILAEDSVAFGSRGLEQPPAAGGIGHPDLVLRPKRLVLDRSDYLDPVIDVNLTPGRPGHRLLNGPVHKLTVRRPRRRRRATQALRWPSWMWGMGSNRLGGCRP
jgi:hypothetical protein